MWDLTGLELTGVYGTWSGRSYELVNHEAEIMTLVMSAEEAPGPDWVHRAPDAFYGESMRWELHVPRTEVTDVHATIVQGTIEGYFVDILAQRHDRAWAVSAESATDTFAELLRRLGLVPAGDAWSGWVPESEVFITSRASYVPWPQPCSCRRSLIMIIAEQRQTRPQSGHGYSVKEPLDQ